MPTLLDKLRATLRRPQNTAADLAAALADAQRAETEAVAAVERQAKAVADGYTEPDAARATARSKLADLRGLAEDAAAIRVELERRHAAALAAEDQERRRAAYHSAKQRAEALASTLAERYSAAAGALVALLRDIVETNEAVDAANAALPSGAVEIVRPETAARATPGTGYFPEEIEIVERWSFADGTPVADEYIDHVVSHGGGRGSYKTVRREGADLVEVGQEAALRKFQRATSYTPVPGLFPTDLVRALRLPELYSDRLALGSFSFPDTWTSDADLVKQAEQALASSAKPAPMSKAEAPKRIELRPMWTAAETAKAHSPRSDYSDRPSRPAPGTGSRFGASPFAPPGARGRSAGGRR